MLARVLGALVALPIALTTAAAAQTARPPATVVEVVFPRDRSTAALDGRLLLLVSVDSTQEPRFQISDDPPTQQVFGTDVEGWRPGLPRRVNANAFGYPIRSLDALPRGHYWIQALLNRYETFRLADGRVLKLPPDKGEGQQWNRKPGNLYSAPRWITLDPRRRSTVPRIVLDQEIPAMPDPPETKYVKHERIQSKLLTEFWGRPTYLGAHVLLPEGFDDHPQARYPLVVFHGHFPSDLGGWRETPPDTTVPCEYSARFRLECYNRIEDQHAFQFYHDWRAPAFPRVLMIEIQHPTPYYDDSYAVNSANNGPYGDAIMRELIPHIERKYRGIGEGWARFTFGGSTGGWEAMAVQMFYPDEFNGAWVACPDPIDFRAYTVVNLYADSNAYYIDGPFRRTPRPGRTDWLGHISVTLEQTNHRELALGSRGRSGDQWDIWQAVYSPAGADGYPKPIWDKLTGRIDRSVAEYWRENYDLSHILRRDWAKGLGAKLRGKLHIYVGDMDNYYLNNAVYLVEEFLKSVTDPPADAEVDYGDRAEHCWNGDQTRANAYSRLRYPQMFIPRILDEIRARHPPGADTVSWRY
ncbi:MAG TPA: hypothetical protein VFM14_02145 [Gemmatimonadales bacterium]|nr:hypothetical protein [Gemmatimonadales bacterium]